MRRVNENEVKLLANLLPTVPSGALLQGTGGLHNVFQYYWDAAQADSFALRA